MMERMRKINQHEDPKNPDNLDKKVTNHDTSHATVLSSFQSNKNNESISRHQSYPNQDKATRIHLNVDKSVLTESDLSSSNQDQEVSKKGEDKIDAKEEKCPWLQKDVTPEHIEALNKNGKKIMSSVSMMKAESKENQNSAFAHFFGRSNKSYSNIKRP